jgi:hypothetical protein
MYEKTRGDKKNSIVRRDENMHCMGDLLKEV